MQTIFGMPTTRPAIARGTAWKVGDRPETLYHRSLSINAFQRLSLSDHLLRPVLLLAMPYWVAVRAALNHERLAWEGVGQAGFETFVPKIRTRVGAQWRTQPLFGSYFFARVIDRWRVLERTMSVINVVKFGAAVRGTDDAEAVAAGHSRTSPKEEASVPRRSWGASGENLTHDSHLP
jgi:Transcription termination factor nusG